MVFFFLFKTPLLYIFGASDQTIGYANDYLDIYLLGTIFVQFALGLNPFITSQGRSDIAMISVLIGAITNIILDPIFIFLFGLGVKGAAIATVISQALSAIWIVYFLTSKRSTIRIRKRYLKPDFSIIKRIASLGISPFIMQSTESLINIILNRGLQMYGGDLYVGSMTIIQSVMQLIVVPTQGFTQGIQPIISYNFGAGQFDRVKQTIRYTICVTFSLTIIACILTTQFPGFFASLFNKNEELLQIVVQVMPIFMAGIFMFGLQMGFQTAFMGLGQAKISLFLALLRKVILLAPLAIILPRIFHTVTSIYYAEPISDIISATTACLIFMVTRHKILSKQALEKLG